MDHPRPATRSTTGVSASVVRVRVGGVTSLSSPSLSPLIYSAESRHTNPRPSVSRSSRPEVNFFWAVKRFVFGRSREDTPPYIKFQEGSVQNFEEGSQGVVPRSESCTSTSLSRVSSP